MSKVSPIACLNCSNAPKDSRIALRKEFKKSRSFQVMFENSYSKGRVVEINAGNTRNTRDKLRSRPFNRKKKSNLRRITQRKKSSKLTKWMMKLAPFISSKPSQEQKSAKE